MSPSIAFYDAYFPFWLVCAFAGIVGAVLLRVVLIRWGIDEGLPLRTAVYTAFGFLIAFILASAMWGV
ncbi:YtcA family lipoprotein [Oceanimonas smirnovii]|uniref:YtcA family lipoprotein n=1 Tax=Oceanimonas smirnovii TaxID=264574 RepID=UPI0003711C77|nr:YtcA family lipoprotein [Oceanimonas smirnovii]